MNKLGLFVCSLTSAMPTMASLVLNYTTEYQALSRRSRIIRLTSICAILVLLLLMLGLFLLPPMAAHMIDAKAREVVAKRKVNISWERVHVGWSGAITMHKLHADLKERGVQADIKKLSVHVAPLSLLGDEPYVNSITCDGVQLEVDIALLQKSQSTSKNPKNKASKPKRHARVERLISTLKSNPPDLHMTDIDTTLSYTQAKVVHVQSTSTTLTHKKGVFTAHANGSFHLLHKKIPVLFKQTKPWALTGSLDLASMHIKAHVTSGKKNTPLFAIGIPTMGQLDLGGLLLNVVLMGKNTAPHISLLDVIAQSEPTEKPVLAITSQEILLSYEDKRPKLSFKKPIFEVDPTRLSELTSRRKEIRKNISLKNLFAQKNTQASKKENEQEDGDPIAITMHKNKLDHVKARSDLLNKLKASMRRFVHILWSVDFDIEQGTIMLSIAQNQQNTPRRMRLMESLHVTTSQGTIDAKGKSAGGSFQAFTMFAPGQWLPSAASLMAQHVDTAKIPGMNQRRTLPNRGVRGRIGGVVDIAMHWMAPLEVLLVKDPLGEAHADIDLSWRKGMVDLHGLADTALEGIEFSTDAHMRWIPGQAQVLIDQGVMRYGQVKAQYNISLHDWPFDPMLRARIDVEKTSCQNMLHAFPEAMLGPYKNVLIEGEAAPKISVKWPLLDHLHFEMNIDGMSTQDNPRARRAWRKSNPTLKNGFPAIEKDWHCSIRHLKASEEGRQKMVFTSAQQQMNVERAMHSSLAQTDSDVHWLKQSFVREVKEGTTGKKRIFVGPGLDTYWPLSELPKHVGAAAYLSEEILFYQNRGISLSLLEKAIRINLERGRFVYGGSTITQQLIKNLFLTRKKTLARKLQEALIALRMDETMTKDRILELYLNCIEFGTDLYGIGPAAQHYFQKPASELTPLEAVFLGVIKPSPRYGQHLQRRGSTPSSGRMQKRMETIFKRLVAYEIITQEEADKNRPFVLKWEKKTGIYIPNIKFEKPEITPELTLDALYKTVAPKH